MVHAATGDSAKYRPDPLTAARAIRVLLRYPMLRERKGYREWTIRGQRILSNGSASEAELQLVNVLRGLGIIDP